jgi:proteasome lid subunit RPN8/RPN11
MKPTIAMTGEIASWLVAHAQENIRDECCGLLAGRSKVIARAFSAINAASQPSTSYEIAPGELFALVREIRAAGLELLGIYHSHPAGENRPSPRDIKRAYYPDAAYFILSPRPDAQKPIRAFSIRDGRASELDVQIV